MISKGSSKCAFGSAKLGVIEPWGDAWRFYCTCFSNR